MKYSLSKSLFLATFQFQVFNYNAEKVKRLPEATIFICKKLHGFLREVKRMEENHVFSYNKDRIPLKTYTIELIEQELTWLQQHRNSLLVEISNANEDFFIVDATVRRLNLWAQINLEIGAIPYHSTSHVIKVMSNYIRTLKPGPTSYESARRKLHKYDPATVKGLHAWLTRQIAHLEKKYGERLHFGNGIDSEL